MLMIDTQWYAVWPNARSTSWRCEMCTNSWFQILFSPPVCNQKANGELWIYDTPRQYL